MSRCSQDAVRIQAEDFSQEEEIRALRASSNGIGGIVTFLGCARDFSEGREVSWMQPPTRVGSFWRMKWRTRFRLPQSRNPRPRLATTTR